MIILNLLHLDISLGSNIDKGACMLANELSKVNTNTQLHMNLAYNRIGRCRVVC